MDNNIVMELKNMKEYVSEFDESIPVKKFSEVGMKDLRSLTPYKVGQVIENGYYPNGLIAWRMADDSRKIVLVFFRGRAAVITEMKNEEIDLRDLFRKASMLHHIDSKRIVTTCA